MGRNKLNRRQSTAIRDNEVHKAYDEIKAELGVLIHEVSRGYIYDRIKAKTGLCDSASPISSTIHLIFQMQVVDCQQIK